MVAHLRPETHFSRPPKLNFPGVNHCTLSPKERGITLYTRGFLVCSSFVVGKVRDKPKGNRRHTRKRWRRRRGALLHRFLVRSLTLRNANEKHTKRPPLAFVAGAGLFFKSKEEMSMTREERLKRRGGSSPLCEFPSRSLKKITGAA